VQRIRKYHVEKVLDYKEIEQMNEIQRIKASLYSSKDKFSSPRREPQTHRDRGNLFSQMKKGTKKLIQSPQAAALKQIGKRGMSMSN
jgi:hypothetical protein